MTAYVSERLREAAQTVVSSVLRALMNEAATVIDARDQTLRSKGVNRSIEEHNLFFGVIGMAFTQWPEQHKFQPDDAEHLRAWILIEAGHCDVFEVPDITKGDIKTIAELGKFFCHGKKHFRLLSRETKLFIQRPRSIKDLGAREFRIVADIVYALLKELTTITPEIYKAERHKAA